jgi:selenide, water dikinase
MGPGDLSEVLAPLPASKDPRLLVGRETFDDAGVYMLSDDVALVQTVDFFAPIVDDPYDFGQIAAANALSDVYAMGGQPLTALNIVAFPTGDLPLSVLTEILRGGQDKVHEAGAHIVGGHSIIDSELKYGLSVTGRAHPAFLLTNAGARPGDALVLTKPIGNGILATALKRGMLADAPAKTMIACMKELNGEASRAALAVKAKCATDITGFGLLGHASHIARASDVTLRIHSKAVTILPHTFDALEPCVSRFACRLGQHSHGNGCCSLRPADLRRPSGCCASRPRIALSFACERSIRDRRSYRKRKHCHRG